jgi:hypothetical protein
MYLGRSAFGKAARERRVVDSHADVEYEQLWARHILALRRIREVAQLAAATAPGCGASGGVVMGIGLGIVLIVIGAILLFALNINIPYVSDNTLGMILIVAGAITLILTLVMNAQRGRTKHVEENRYEGPPPAI